MRRKASGILNFKQQTESIVHRSQKKSSLESAYESKILLFKLKKSKNREENKLYQLTTLHMKAHQPSTQPESF